MILKGGGYVMVVGFILEIERLVEVEVYFVE